MQIIVNRLDLIRNGIARDIDLNRRKERNVMLAEQYIPRPVDTASSFETTSELTLANRSLYTVSHAKRSTEVPRQSRPL